MDDTTPKVPTSHHMQGAILPLANRHEVYQFVWTASVLCVLVAVWTGLRIYSRTVRQMPLGWEDLLYHVSVVSCLFFFLFFFSFDMLWFSLDPFCCPPLPSTLFPSFRDHGLGTSLNENLGSKTFEHILTWRAHDDHDDRFLSMASS